MIKERFYEKFYEGEGNSVKCHNHTAYATPFEVLAFFAAELILLAEEIEEESSMRYYEREIAANLIREKAEEIVVK